MSALLITSADSKGRFEEYRRDSRRRGYRENAISVLACYFAQLVYADGSQQNRQLTKKIIKNTNQGITMKRIISRGGVLATMASLAFALPAFGQDDDGGPITQGVDAAYIQATAVKFKPGKRERAMEIIAEYFVPASEKAGLAGPHLVLHMQTGRWDMVIIWNMEGGMADLEWYRSEDDIKWLAALAEIAGGEKKGEALWQEYIGSVADSTTEVGHYHTGETE